MVNTNYMSNIFYFGKNVLLVNALQGWRVQCI